MTKKSLGRLFSILTALLIILLPVSYAQQLSETNTAGSGTTPQAVDANTCSEAYRLAELGTNYYAYINYAGDIDWFYWELPSSGKFTADLDVPSNRDYELKVYTSCSTEACSSSKGKGSDEQCTINAGSGKVYAKVWGYKNDYSASDKYYIKGGFAAATQFDLAPTGFSVTPSSPKDTDSISVLYEVKNNGPDDITSYFNFKLYIDDELKQTCNSNSGLKAGWYGKCTKSSLSLSSGMHTLKLVADADNSIAETNENNNEKTETLPISHVPRYDLAPGGFTITPSSPKESDSITIRYRATNNGPDDIASGFKYKLYIDNTPYHTCLADNGQKIGTTYCEKSGIKLSEGTYVLKNVVDTESQVQETDENNNEKTQDLTVSSSCPSDKPYKYDGSCHACSSNELECGGSCYDKESACSYGEPHCSSNEKAYCCSSDFPVNCAKTDNCWKSQSECDNSQKCGSESWTVCRETGFPHWNCRSDGTSRCCPTNYPYIWNSDWLCHTTTEPQKCSVPDGSSANCDCDTDADCQKADSSKPYCGQTYGKRTSNGYHACLTAKPQHCGDGTCNNGETYSTCNTDCTAPKGKITARVYQSTTGKAISGAYIHLDSVPKGTTNSEGKASFEANYGNRNVKAECPDKKYCEERTINVDGEEYASFACGCTVQESELQIKVRTLHSATDEGYPIYNAYVFLNGEKKGLTDTFGNLYISEVNYGNHQLGIGLKIADNENDEPYEHRYSYDLLANEAFEEMTINVELPSQQQSLSKNIADANPNVVTASDYNATYSPETIPLVVAAIVWVGFTAWAYGDYAKCVEETNSWWKGFGKLSWDGLSCSPAGLAIGTAINKEHMGNCLKRASMITRNTWEKCKLDAAFLGIMFIPPAWIASAAGKAFVVIKGSAYSIPYVEKFLGYSFKVIAQSETFIKISNGINEFGFKVIGGSLKIYDNVVGMIVKVMKNAGVSSKITTAVDNIMRATTFSDLTGLGKNVGNIKGALGEKAAVKTANIVGDELSKEGATFVRPSGSAKTVLKESGRYSLRFDSKGKVEIFDKINNNRLGELDDFYLINGKPVVTEVKTMAAGSLDQQITGRWNLFPPGWEDGLAQKVPRNLNAIKEVTGETPEFIIMIPKGEASASKQLPNLLKDVRNAGFKAEYAELEATNSAFDSAARRIYNEAKQGGK